jgi:hypothetical protein
VPPDTDDDLPGLRDALKRVAVALKEIGTPFALCGGYAAWSRGSPEPLHDVDFLVREEDADVLAEELRRRGFDVQEPPEDWLFKVHVDGALVDVLHRANRTTVEEVLAGAEERAVLSVRMPVISATDVVAQKLLALDEHYCDLAAVLPTLRALREQVDWDRVRQQVADAPFAEAAVFLLERLDVVAPGDPRGNP